MDSKEEEVDILEGDAEDIGLEDSHDYESDYSDESSDEEQQLNELHEGFLNSGVTLTGLLEVDAMARLNECVETYDSDMDMDYETGDEMEYDLDMEGRGTEQAVLKKLQNCEEELKSAKLLIQQLRDKTAAVDKSRSAWTLVAEWGDGYREPEKWMVGTFSSRERATSKVKMVMEKISGLKLSDLREFYEIQDNIKKKREGVIMAAHAYDSTRSYTINLYKAVMDEVQPNEGVDNDNSDEEEED